jgi:putative ABC transport system permease protein
VRGWWRDLWQGARGLKRSPGTAALAVLTLAVGMALVTVQYTPVHKLLFQPLPFDPTGRMVVVRWSGPPSHSPGARLRQPELAELARFQRSFHALTGYGVEKIGHSIRLGDGRWIQRVGIAVLPGFLQATGIELQLGRGLAPEDHRPGAGPVLVLSHRFWQDLGGRPDILGATIHFDRRHRTIVGVARQDAPMVDGETFWAPAEQPITPASREASAPFQALALLRPAVTLEQADHDVKRLLPGTSEHLRPELFRELGALEVVRARDGLLHPRILEFYRLLLVVVTLVLFCSCANVTNLLLARAAGRRQELAVRASLGATRAHLLRQAIGECLLIGLAAAALGIALSAGLARFARLQTEVMPLPSWVSFAIDARVAAAVTAISLAATTLAGLLSALRSSRLDIQAVLKEDARTTSATASSRTSAALLVLQIAVSAGVLLVAFCAGWTWRERLGRTLRVDPERYLAANLVFPRDEFPTDDRVHAVLRALDQKLRELPPPIAGGVSTRAGLGPGREAMIEVSGEGPPGHPVFHAAVGLSYFGALRTPIIEGRGFRESDARNAPAVAIVDTRFAHRFWPGAAAVGRTFAVLARNQSRQVLQVVGVVPSLHMGGAANHDADAPGFFTPLAQLERRAAVVPFVSGPAGTANLGKTLAGIIRAVDPEREPRRTWTFRQQLDEGQSGLRIYGQLLGLFGVAALVLAAVGLYGLIALAVRQRTREVGTRMALGATAPGILSLFLLRSARHLALGLAAGGALGWLLLFLSERRLGPLGGGPPAYLLVAAVFAIAGVAATILPAWRAARLSPTLALRQP